MENDIDILKLKKYFKVLIIYLILGIPLSMFIFNKINITSNTINLLMIFLLSIFYIIVFFILGLRYLKQKWVVREKIFKETLLKIGFEEDVSKEQKKEYSYYLSQNLGDNISYVDYIFKLKIKSNRVDFIKYATIIDSYNSKYEYYNAMVLEIPNKHSEEIIQKIILEKNKKYFLNYSLKTIENKIVISVLEDPNFDIVKELSDPTAELLKEVILEIV